MPKFFVEPCDVDEKIYLKGDNYHHGINVLRLREGDKITVCDGSLKDYEAEISEIYSEYAVCEILSYTENLIPSKIRYRKIFG